MRVELNAAQSPLTMGNCAQPEMTGSRFDCPGSESLGAPQVSIKKPLPAAGAHNRFVVADGLRGQGIWRECHPVWLTLQEWPTRTAAFTSRQKSLVVRGGLFRAAAEGRAVHT